MARHVYAWAVVLSMCSEPFAQSPAMQNVAPIKELGEYIQSFFLLTLTSSKTGTCNS